MSCFIDEADQSEIHDGERRDGIGDVTTVSVVGKYGYYINLCSVVGGFCSTCLHPNLSTHHEYLESSDQDEWF